MQKKTNWLKLKLLKLYKSLAFFSDEINSSFKS